MKNLTFHQIISLLPLAKQIKIVATIWHTKNIRSIIVFFLKIESSFFFHFMLFSVALFFSSKNY